jgi:ATP-dependent Clp protease ATP-binding subunit ClpA
MPFEKFTVQARQVVVAAQEEARLLKHNHIGTEHILLALLDAPDSMAAKVLHQLGYDKATAQVDIAAVVEPGTANRSGHIPFTPRAKKTLELALREATQLHHNYIGTEHILLGILSDDQDSSAQALAALGVTHEAAETWFVAKLAELTT